MRKCWIRLGTSCVVLALANSPIWAGDTCDEEFLDCNENGVHDYCDISCSTVICDLETGMFNRCDLIYAPGTCGCVPDVDFSSTPDDCDCRTLSGMAACPTMSLVVVARHDANGNLQWSYTPPTNPNDVGTSPPVGDVHPGDVLTVEIQARWWAHGAPHVNGQLDPADGYQGVINYDTYFNAPQSSGNILPVGFKTITDPTDRCPLGQAPSGGSNNMNAFIDRNHPAFIFGPQGVPATQLRTCDYRFGAGVFPGAGTPVNIRGAHLPAYLGTLKLKVSNDAAGEFNLCLGIEDVNCNLPGSEQSYIRPFGTGNASSRILKMDFECAKIIVDNEPPSGCASMAASVPPSNTIDARQSSLPDGSGVSGYSQLDVNINYTNGCDNSDVICNLACPLWSVETVPAGAEPTVTNVAEVDPDTVHVTLSGPITPNAWSKVCLDDPMSDAITCTCLGFQPGDVDGNRTSQPADITRLVQCLNGSLCALNQADINRSGVINPQDLIREVDVLNGADSLNPKNGTTLPLSPCGS